MKPFLHSLARCLSLLAIILTSTSVTFAQDANWNGGAGNGLWNSDLNWDTGLTPGELTNAFIDAATVSYNTPMTSLNVGSVRLTSGSVLSINNTGFAVGSTGTDALFVSGPTSALVINNGGVVNVAGGLTLSNITATTVNVGGTLNITGTLFVGAGSMNGTDKAGVITNWGGNITAAGLRITPGSGNANSRAAIRGGTNNLGNVVIQRSNAGAGGFLGVGTEGLVIYDGLVNMASLDVGGTLGNTFLTAYVGSGLVTNSGAFTVRQVTPARASRFLQTGGIFESMSDDAHLRGPGQVLYSVMGGTNIVLGFALTEVGDTTSEIRMTNMAKIYIGDGGFYNNGGTPGAVNIRIGGGIFGAQQDWTATADAPMNLLLAGGTFDCAALDGTPHNITLNGILSGAGGLTKTGGGVLTLGAANTYSGETTVTMGTLALNSAGTIAGSIITVSNGATFDISALGNYNLTGSQVLRGRGTVLGNLTAPSGASIRPAGNNLVGTLTFSNNLVESGGVQNTFDLSTNYLVASASDSVNIVGNLDISGGIQTIEISPIEGALHSGSVYTLFTYGSLTGGTNNLALSGATGKLTNDTAAKAIKLIVASSSRAAGNVSWVGNGNALNNNWDMLGLTNWSFAGALTSFIPGDTAHFNATGSTHPMVNIVTNVSADSVVVEAATDYVFFGDGSINGIGGLLKTNTGTLTILTTNNYSGPTLVAQGVLVATNVANGAVPSSIGSSTAIAANLVVGNATFRYVGGTASTDRGATLNGNATIEIPDGANALTFSGIVTGAGSLTKTGLGTLALGGNSDYSGGTTINDGTLRINSNLGAGAGGITNNSKAILIGDAITTQNPIHFNGACTIDLNNIGGNISLDGAWSGSATVTVVNQAVAEVFTIGGPMDTFSGTINMGTSPGILRFNDGGGLGGGPNFGSSLATFDLGTSTCNLRARNGGTTNYLGALIGGLDTRIIGYSNNADTNTWVIGGNNLSTVFEGIILDGARPASTRITKVGTGKLTLTAHSTYTGPTIVNGGELQINNLNDSLSILVQAGTLSGNSDFFFNTFQVDNGGTLSPGASIGTMQFNNLPITLNGNLLIEVNKSESPSSDALLGVSGVSGTGTITVNNLGPALVVGDKFYPFVGTMPGAGALTVSGAGATWSNDIEIDGSITVTGLAVPQPTIGTITRSGNSVVITGSNGPTAGNYIVLGTNNVAAPVANWTRLSTNPYNPNGTFSVTNTILPGVPVQFYRIQNQ